MSILVIAEHDNASIKGATLHTVMAAAQIVMFTDAQVHLVVMGHQAEQAAQEGAHIAGVAQVIHIDGAEFAHDEAGHSAAQIRAIAPNCGHILFAATAWGRLIASRLAVQLGVTLINDIVSIESADTFQHAIHEGLETATVQSTDAIKVLTVRTTPFEAVPATGGFATVEIVAAAAPGRQPTMVGSEIAKNDRPTHTAARGEACAPAADDVPVLDGYGHLWGDLASGELGARQFDRGDPQRYRGLGLRSSSTRSRSEPVRDRARGGALDFVNPGV
ncbi:hypothetical protein [Rhodoferax sp.]|uniref:hypothetical protein n=1 Tax=Rhodoferax sp. TaxID=50421 RepID=UPI0026313C23|nr:hypothetical protein [Rhodoferax sp.]MDD2920380.1 hypothetical protein [Rhodoferax sp.]